MRYLPLGLVLALVVAGLLQIALYYWRQGTGLIGCALLAAAGLRAVLSEEQVGLLAVRGRGVDMLHYSGLGLLVLFVALTIEGGPLAAS